MIRVFGRVEALEEEVRTIKADSAGRDQRQDRKHKERPIEELHRAKRVEATVQKTKDAKRCQLSIRAEDLRRVDARVGRDSHPGQSASNIHISQSGTKDKDQCLKLP